MPSHVWLCDLMDCSMPKFPVLHCLLEFAQTHIHWVSGAIQPSHPLSPPTPPAPQSFPASGSFPMSLLFPSGGQSIGASASAWALPMNMQGWFPLGWTGWISFLFKRLSRFSPAPQFESINSSVLSFLYDPTLTPILIYWKNHSFDYSGLCLQSMSLLFNTLSRFLIAFLPRSIF